MGRQNNEQGLQTIHNYAAKSYALMDEENKKTDIYKSENEIIHQRKRVPNN